ASIFIHCEHGTGKVFIARCIHANSARAQGAFVAMNCTVLPSTMLEHELWGYEKDAFAGALHLRRGLLELAEGGTLFFDEIAELDLDLQTKLLRVLQDRQFQRMGGKYSLAADFRVISASVRDPLLAVQAKTLRHDLFYRLNVVPIVLPPLRERKEDIPSLTRIILQDFAQTHERNILEVPPEALELLMQYPWPGNVRELRQVLESLAARTLDGGIALADLPEQIRKGEALPCTSPQYDRMASLREARQKWVEQFERKYLIDLLNQYNGNISRVARRAGVHRMTIYRMLKNYDITITPRRAE
ncbi:MAG: sigma-54 dependent transcriptional regulator, partial [candidate division KSB1 bacterium]